MHTAHRKVTTIYTKIPEFSRELLELLKELLYGVCHEIREFLVGLRALDPKLNEPIPPDTIQEIWGLCKQVATNEYLIALVVTGIAYFIVCEFLFYLEREIEE